MLDNSLQLLHPTNRRSFTENKCNINNSIEAAAQHGEYAVFEPTHNQQVLGFFDQEEQFLSGNQEFLPMQHNNMNNSVIGVEQSLIQNSYFKPEDAELHIELGAKQQQLYDQSAEISAKSSFSDSTLASSTSMNYYDYSKPSSSQLKFQTPQQQPQYSQNYYFYRQQQQQSQLENSQQQTSDQSIRQQSPLMAPQCGSYLCTLKHQTSYHQHPQQQAMQQAQYIDYYNIYEQQQHQHQVKRPVFTFPDEKPFKMQFHQHSQSSQQYYKEQFPQPQQVFIPEPSEIPLHDDHFTLPLHQPANERLAEFSPSNEAQPFSSCATSQFFSKAPIKGYLQGQQAPNKIDQNQNQKLVQSPFLPAKFPVLTMKKPNSVKIELLNVSEQITEENDLKIISKTESEPQREAALSSSHTLLRRPTAEASTIDQQDQEIQDIPEINSANNNNISHEAVSLAEIAERTDFYTPERKTEVTFSMQKSNKKNVVRNIMRTFKQYFLAKETGEQIMDTFFSGQNTKDVQQKFKRYFSQRKFNHQAIKQLVQHEKYGVVFHQFLKAHSIAFLKTTKPKVQELHQTFIDFLLLCYWDIELLDNLETYSKIKNPFQ